jgi:hypothetical protein
MNDEIPLTRDELYELIWTEPMTKVSTRLGLSDVGLAKICREADIPVPPRGYWAKKRSGHRVQRKRLPKVDEPIEFVFRPQPMPELPKPVEPEYPPEVVALIEAAKKLQRSRLVVSLRACIHWSNERAPRSHAVSSTIDRLIDPPVFSNRSR